MTNENTVTINVDRYKELLEAEALLDCLKACGVDNWNGWSEAHEMMNEEEEE
jgi:hypothetical protein